MVDKQKPKPNAPLHGTSLPDAHKQDPLPHDQAAQAAEIDQLQKKLRTLRAEEASDTHLQKSEAEQRGLLIEIEKCGQRLKQLGGYELPPQA